MSLVSGDPSIQLEAIEHRYAGSTTAALAAIDLRIARGVVTGLVGPDGAGKTTLLRLMAGLLEASAGQLRVEGMDPIADPTRLRRVVAYMPQKFGLYEELTVLDNLTLYADLRGVIGNKRQHAFGRLLEFTGLQPFTGRLAGKLSGGMKQKLGLACALLGSPRVLLLDEPSVGVDPISRRELWKMVETLVQDGMTVVWSTSYLDEAERCDAVALLNAGRIAYAGTPGELRTRMRGRSLQLRHIAGNKRRVLQRALRLQEIIDGTIQGRDVRLVLRDAGRVPDLAALAAGPEARLEPVVPRLEDAFIDFLGGGPGGDSVLSEHVAHVRLPPNVDPDTVIEAVGLTRRFGDFVATDHVTFTVKRGEIFGLLGPNGAGKSTTFKMMCGLLPPSGGQARVLGIDLKTSMSRARQQLGYMAQKFSLYGGLSVAENLRFFSGIYGLRRATRERKIADMVGAFALEPYVRTPASELPLGFKQRLALACALMHEPALLFLDEPTSGVDPITRREFWTHINGLVDKGVTVMVTTHFMDEAEYCDRIGLVNDGRLVAIGTPDELKQATATRDLPDPSMEDAFVRLVSQADARRRAS